MNKTEKWGIFKSAVSSVAGMLASGTVSSALSGIFAVADAVTGKNVSTFKKVTRVIGTSLVAGYVGAKVEERTVEQLSEYDISFQVADGADVIEYATAKAKAGE